MDIKHVAILGAMPEEIGEIINQLHDKKEIFYGDLKVIQGIWNEVVRKNKILISVAWSGWGKVSSARAATRIISSIYLEKKVTYRFGQQPRIKRIASDGKPFDMQDTLENNYT